MAERPSPLDGLYLEGRSALRPTNVAEVLGLSVRSLSEKFPKKIQRRVLDSRGDLEAWRDRRGVRCGEQGATDDDAEQASGMPHQKISARRRELVLLGLSRGRETPGRPVAADALSSGRP